MVEDLLVKEVIIDAISSKNYDVVMLYTMFVVLSLCMIFVAISTLVWGVESKLLLLRSV